MIIVPAGLFLIIGVVLRLTKRKFSNTFLFIGLTLMFIPIVFIIGHLNSVGKEMKSRAGTYIVTWQDNSGSLCGNITFDSLKLTLDESGEFYFSYKPCFADKLNGKWKWYEDMITTGTTFDKINDSLYLNFSTNGITDTIVLKKNQMTFLTFSKVDTHNK